MLHQFFGVTAYYVLPLAAFLLSAKLECDDEAGLDRVSELLRILVECGDELVCLGNRHILLDRDSVVFRECEADYWGSVFILCGALFDFGKGGGLRYWFVFLRSNVYVQKGKFHTFPDG